MAINISGTPEEIAGKLKKRHPWYEEMARDENWPTLRAVQGDLNNPETLKRFLVKPDFEKEVNYLKRVELTEFQGVTGQIVGRFCAAVFREGPKIDLTGETDLKAWDADVDGQGSELQEFIEEVAEEAALMGRVGILPDRPAAPEGAERPETVADEEAQGTRNPILRVFQTEEIVNWGIDDRDRLEWVQLERDISRQDQAGEDRELVRQWIILDNEEMAIFEGVIEEVITSEGEKKEVTKKRDVKTARQIGPTRAHGAGRVPFICFYGRRRRTDRPMIGRSFLQASARADKAGLNEDSLATWGRATHLLPLGYVKSRKAIEEISKSPDAWLQLDPDEGEGVGYAETNPGSFSVGLDAVEARTRSAFRQAGAEGTGQVSDMTGPESGRAKEMRFAHGESRTLVAFAKSIEQAHRGVYEIVKRLMMPTAPTADERAFDGTVKYSREFDLSTADERVELYGEARRWIKSEAWHRRMLASIALSSIPEMDQDDRDTVDEEIQNQTLDFEDDPQGREIEEDGEASPASEAALNEVESE